MTSDNTRGRSFAGTKLYVKMTINGSGAKLMETCEEFNKLITSDWFIEAYFDAMQADKGDGFKVEMVEMTEEEYNALPEFAGF